MFNNKYNGLLTGLLIAAIVGIVGLMGFFGWSVFNKYYLNSKAEEAVSNFEEEVKKDKPTEDEGNRTQIGDVEGSGSIYQGQGNTSKYYGYEILRNNFNSKNKYKISNTRKRNTTIN